MLGESEASTLSRESLSVLGYDLAVPTVWDKSRLDSPVRDGNGIGNLSRGKSIESDSSAPSSSRHSSDMSERRLELLLEALEKEEQRNSTENSKQRSRKHQAVPHQRKTLKQGQISVEQLLQKEQQEQLHFERPFHHKRARNPMIQKALENFPENIHPHLTMWYFGGDRLTEDMKRKKCDEESRIRQTGSNAKFTSRFASSISAGGEGILTYTGLIEETQQYCIMFEGKFKYNSNLAAGILYDIEKGACR